MMGKLHLNLPQYDCFSKMQTMSSVEMTAWMEGPDPILGKDPQATKDYSGRENQSFPGMSIPNG